MSDEKPDSGLTAAEDAYFNSAGETPLAPQPESTPEPERAAGSAEAPPRDEKGRWVNHGALHEEREEHRQTKAQLEELRDFKTRMEERWRLVESAAERQQQPAPTPPPNPDEDIFAFSKWQAEQLQDLKTQIEGKEKQTQEQKQAQEYENQVWSHWNQDAAAFKAKTPDFTEAVSWMSETRTKQLKALAPLHPQFRSAEGINQQINAELRDIVVASAQNGVSASEYLYGVAKEWGWAKPAEKATEAPQAAPLTLPAQLAKVAGAQSASRTVGAAPGSAGGQELTLEAAMAMNPADFAVWHKDPVNARKFEKLMGR